MQHSTVHTSCLNRLHTTWYVVMQDKKLKPREAFNCFFPPPFLIAMIRQAPSRIANDARSPRWRVSVMRSSLLSRRRTELPTEYEFTSPRSEQCGQLVPNQGQGQGSRERETAGRNNNQHNNENEKGDQ